MNSIIITGRLVRDVEVKTLQNSDKIVAQYTMAVDRAYSKNGNKEADFINIVTYGKSAEYVSKYAHKGKMIAVKGRLQIRNYEGKDGKKVYVTEVISEEVQILEWDNNGSEGKGYKDMEPVDNSSIPF